ncbi:MAG: NHL repeat-containing protein [Candidatus Bruticola sp.]
MQTNYKTTIIHAFTKAALCCAIFGLSAWPVQAQQPSEVTVSVPPAESTSAAEADTATEAASPEQTNSETTEESPAAPAASTDTKTATDNESVKSLQDLNAELQKGKVKTIDLEMKKKPRFTMLQSSNPEDYKRLSGIWISDTGNGRIVYMKNIQGEDFYPLGLSGSGLGRFLNPEQIWVDVTGKVYIADRGNNRIIRIDDIRGLGWTEMDNGFKGPKGVAFHGKRLYISDTENNRILVYEKFGDTEPMAELKDSKINKPGYLWLDMDGNLYVCCGEGTMKGQIVRIPFDLTALPSTWQVYRGQNLSGAAFTPTQFVKTDDGVFFVDIANQRLVKADNFRGKNHVEIGSYGRGAFQFLEPKGLSSSEDGSKIYIADTGNDRIVCLDPKQANSWETYDSQEPTFGLRSPKCVYVWSPRPLPNDDDSQDKEDEKKATSSGS